MDYQGWPYDMNIHLICELYYEVFKVLLDNQYVNYTVVKLKWKLSPLWIYRPNEIKF